MKPANFAPMYCAMYPDLAEIARKHGYALAVHGSLARDFDLICIPWTDKPSATADVIQEITETFSVRVVAKSPQTKQHGREVWTLQNGFGACFLDFSFMPAATTRHIPSVWDMNVRPESESKVREVVITEALVRDLMDQLMCTSVDNKNVHHHNNGVTALGQSILSLFAAKE